MIFLLSAAMIFMNYGLAQERYTAHWWVVWVLTVACLTGAEYTWRSRVVDPQERVRKLVRDGEARWLP